MIPVQEDHCPRLILGKTRDPIQKIIKAKRAGGMNQMVESA
jgi:hypothetical protein